MILNIKSEYISCKFKVPKKEKRVAVPNKNQPDIKEPEIKYFRPASVEKAEFRLYVLKI